MPEKQNPKRQFIKEQVVRPALSRRELIKRAGFFAVVAILCGLLAAVSFVLGLPVANRLLGEKPVAEAPISIPKDEPSEPTMAPETEAETETESESEPIEDQVHSALENYSYTIDDLNSMMGSLRTSVQAANKGIVVVHSVQQNVDWFDNQVETSGLYAGAVIAHTSQELLILTPEAAVEKADSIKVTFGDGKDVDGRMKQKDSLSHMAIVSVNVSDVDETIREDVQVLSLGNSYTVREGDLIIAIGGPSGVIHSQDYGFVSYVLRNSQRTDQNVRVFYGDILSNTQIGTFVMNTAGELVGWVTQSAEANGAETERQMGNATEIMGISDYKGILEKLTNGLGASCVGIMGQEVSDAMMQQGLPKGIYVTEVVSDRPAYSAGIQTGDIIIKIDDKELTTMKEYQNVVEGLECGQLINVTVERNGRDQYTQLEFQVTVEAR